MVRLAPSSSQRPRTSVTGFSRRRWSGLCFAGGDVRHALRPLVQIAGMFGVFVINGDAKRPSAFHELVCVRLGFLPCRKGVERSVSHLRVLGNPPSIAATLPGVLCDIDCEGMGLFHGRIMRQRRQRRQSECWPLPKRGFDPKRHPNAAVRSKGGNPLLTLPKHSIRFAEK